MATKANREENEEKQRRIRRTNRGTGIEGADWGEAKADLIQQAITLITKVGCAVQFGLTKDQGAYVIRIVGDGEPYNEFIRPTEDIDLYLTGVIEDFKNAQ